MSARLVHIDDYQPDDRPVTICCEREFGTWTIRVNGRYVMSFWREATARRLAMNIRSALNRE